MIGAETYAIVKNLSSPETTSSKTFEQLCIILKSHYEPKTLVIAERFKFHNRDQGEIESVQHFFNELKNLSKTCEFGQFLDDALRDRFVCGLYDDNIQKRLLSEKDLTATKALTTAAAWEMTNKNMRVIKEQSTTVVKKIMKEEKPCFRCKKLGHKPENCRFKNATCYKCEEKGHISPACKQNYSRTEKKDVFTKRREGTKGSKRRVNEVPAAETESEEEELHHLAN